MSETNVSNILWSEKPKNWAQLGSLQTSFTVLLETHGFRSCPFKCSWAQACPAHMGGGALTGDVTAILPTEINKSTHLLRNKEIDIETVHSGTHFQATAVY